MATLDYEFFLDQFRAMETTTLLQNVIERDLTESAMAALRTVLAERGVDGERLEQSFLAAQKDILLRSGVTNECDYCGKTVLLGALRKDHQKFCSDRCARNSSLMVKAIGLAPDLVDEHAWRIASGACPECGCDGGLVEMRPIHMCVSILVASLPFTERPLQCRKCAVRDAWLNSAATFLFGWWSLTGLVRTPVTIWRNVRVILRDTFVELPSPALRRYAALDLAERLSISDMGDKPPCAL